MHDATITTERGYTMSIEDFTEFYINASEEVRIEIEETLNKLQTQSASPEKDLKTDHTVL